MLMNGVLIISLNVIFMTADTITKFWENGTMNIKNIAPETAAQPTSEELAMIKKFKKNGWV